jgi:hypothetical protein
MGIFGSDERAMKMGGHEVLGATELYHCKIPNIHAPLVCLIDYLGFRLVAMSLLPIDNTTVSIPFSIKLTLWIVYGTSDAGHTVHNSNEEMNTRMKKLGVKLHLKPHLCGRGSVKQELFTAADIEGHLGKDQRLYCVDLARYNVRFVALISLGYFLPISLTNQFRRLIYSDNLDLRS